MSPPAANDTGTTLGQDGSDWSRDLATLNFDLGGHGACDWCGSSSSTRALGLKFVMGLVTLTLSFDLLTLKLVASRIKGAETLFRIWER